jgi:photosystem II stability/assembly factor-like uncharacterized protein
LKVLYKLILLFITFIGVANSQGQLWENLNGPKGGLINSIIRNKTDLFCAGNGGVFVSSDNGENWKCLGLRNEAIIKISIISSYLFAISNNGCYRNSIGDSVWFKVKNGSWQSLYGKDSVVFIGADYSGIYRSFDFGNTWTEVNNGINNRAIVSLYITSNNIVLASAAGASGSGVFRSTNMGDDWERIDPYQFAWNFYGITEYENTLYAFDFSNSAKIYKSNDWGITWSMPPNSTNPSDIIQSIYSDNRGIYVGVYSFGVFKTTNEGEGWIKLNNGLNNKNVFSFVSSDSQIFAATYDGIYRANKSHYQWEKKSNGINNCWVTSLATFSNKLLIGTYGSGLFIKDNSGLQRVNMGSDLMYVSQILVSDDNLYVIASQYYPGPLGEILMFSLKSGLPARLNNNYWALKNIALSNKYVFGGSDNGMFRLANTNSNWEQLTNGVPTNVNVASVAVSDSVAIITNGTSEIYRSTNNGNSWQVKNIPELFTGGKLYSPENEKGTFYLGDQSVDFIFKSTDYGQTWDRLNNPLANSAVQSFFANDSEIYTGTSSSGILFSSDSGNTWDVDNYGLESSNITSFTKIGGVIYAGSRYNGIYQRVVDRTQLIAQNNLYNQNSITFKWTSTSGINEYRFQISTDSSFKTILYDYSGIKDTSITLNNLNYNSTYYWRVSSVTKYWNNMFTRSQKIVINNPQNFHLYQNYPNPFNNQTAIMFEVSNNGIVELSLFDILGRKISTLLKKEFIPGSYKYNLNTEKLASGIYIVQMKATGYNNSIKIILLK